MSTQIATRLAGLEWLLVLHSTAPAQVFAWIDELFPALLKTLCDPSDEVREGDGESCSGERRGRGRSGCILAAAATR